MQHVNLLLKISDIRAFVYYSILMQMVLAMMVEYIVNPNVILFFLQQSHLSSIFHR